MGLNSIESFDPNNPPTDDWSRLSSSLRMEGALEERSKRSHDFQEKSSSYSNCRKKEMLKIADNATCAKEKKKNQKNKPGSKEENELYKYKPITLSSSRSSCKMDGIGAKERAEDKEDLYEKHVEDEKKSEKSEIKEKQMTYVYDVWIKEKIMEKLDEMESQHSQEKEPCIMEKGRELSIIDKGREFSTSIDSNRRQTTRGQLNETVLSRGRQRYNSETIVKEPCCPPEENEEFVPEKGDLCKEEVLDSLSKDFNNHGFDRRQVMEKIRLNIDPDRVQTLPSGIISMEQVRAELEGFWQTSSYSVKDVEEDEHHHLVDCSLQVTEKPFDFGEDEKQVKGFQHDILTLGKKDISIETEEELKNKKDGWFVGQNAGKGNVKLFMDSDEEFFSIQAKIKDLEKSALELLSFQHQTKFEVCLKQGQKRKKQRNSSALGPESQWHDEWEDGISRHFLWWGHHNHFRTYKSKVRSCKGDFNPDSPNGRGDNPSWNEMGESESDRQNSHGSQRSDEQEETEKEKQGRRNDDEKDKDENEIPPAGKEGRDSIAEDRVSKNLEVIANYKFRRKHGSVQGGESGLVDLLGLVLNENEELKVPPDIFEEINLCLMTSMQVKSAGETTNCYVCSHLSALICHFGSCILVFNTCQTCLTMFRLIQRHVSVCGLSDSFTSEVTCPVIICVKIKRAEMAFDSEEKLWKKLKKNLARFANPDTEDDDAFRSISSYSSLSSMGSINSGKLPPKHTTVRPRLSTVTRPCALESIPEGGMGLTSPRKPPAKSASRSEPIMMKKADSTIVVTGNLPARLMTDDQVSLGATSLPQSVRYSSLGQTVSRPRDLFSDSTDHPLLPEPKVGLKSSRERTPGSNFEALTSPRDISAPDVVYLRSSFSESDGSAHNSLPAVKDSSLDNLPTNGGDYVSLPSHVFDRQNEFISIPINRQRSEMGERFQSLVDRPTGIPGIKDVVYGERQYLQVVAKIWFENKNQLMNGKKDSREEGVILPKYQDRLKILKTRYSKNFQWVRLSHLGSGTSGKCHLAMDFNTEYKFCIKKIHISKYEVKELEIWSELQHKNIVQLIGTLRRGEKIYIMSEFIDGGCLTETINSQRSLQRRLSQKTALNYLKQILEALVYLQKKYVIHEDLKADNILVRSGTQDIVITDFGVARKHTSTMDKRGTTTSGSQIVFSPEKARGEGHEYKSDLWSAICVFYHMLTGYPPWVKKYPNLGALLYVIIEEEPDIPNNINPDITDLIRMGFKKDPSLRPGPDQLLRHKAFRILDGAGPDVFYSTLISSVRNLTDENKIQPPDQQEIDVLAQIEEDLQSLHVDSIQNERLNSLRERESARKSPVENEEQPTENENRQNSSIDIIKIAKDLGLSVPEDVVIREEQPPNDPYQQFLIDNGEISMNVAGLEELESSTEKQSSDTEQSFSDLDFEDNPHSFLPVFQLLFTKEEALTEQEKQDNQQRKQFIDDHNERVLSSQLSRSESQNKSFDSQVSSRVESSELPQERILDHISELPAFTRSSLEVPNLTVFKDSSSLSSDKVTLKDNSGSSEQSDSKASVASKISSPKEASVGLLTSSTSSALSPKIEIHRPTSSSPSSMFSIREEDISEDDLFGSGEGVDLLKPKVPTTSPSSISGNSNNSAIAKKTTPGKLYLDLSPASRRRKFTDSKKGPNTADIQSSTSPVPPTAPYFTPQMQKPPPFQAGSKSKSKHLGGSGLSKSSSHGSQENSGDYSHSQQQEEIDRYMEELSSASGAGPDLSMSIGEDDGGVSFGLEDEDDMETSMAYITQHYMNSASNTAHGIRLMVHHKDSNITFTMVITGSTVKQSWKEIIQNELENNVQSAMKVSRFILLDGYNQPLDLNKSPSQDNMLLYVQEVDDQTNAPWYCEQGMVMG